MCSIIPFNNYIFASSISLHNQLKHKTMKKTLTISVIAGCILLMSAFGVSAAVPAGKASKVSKEQVRNEITRNISCPDFVAENSAANDVKAIVQVNESGKVTITDINSGNPKLLDYVAAQLENMTVKNVTGTEKFILTVHFRVE